MLNEPYFATLGSSVVPVDRDTVRSGWEDISALVEGGLGIHCCSNTDWEFVLDLRPSVVSIDAYATAKEFLLYTDSLITYMEGGGVVPGVSFLQNTKSLLTETTDTLYQKYLAIRRQALFPYAELFDAQSLITPSLRYTFCRQKRGSCNHENH